MPRRVVRSRVRSAEQHAPPHSPLRMPLHLPSDHELIAEPFLIAAFECRRDKHGLTRVS